MNDTNQQRRSNGIYAIVNTKTCKAYIGRSWNVAARFVTHRWNLNRKRHPNKALQQDWLVYGESAFEFKVLEYAEKDDYRYCVALEGAWVIAYQDQGIELYNIAITTPWVMTPCESYKVVRG